MDMIFPPTWVEFKIKVTSIEDMEYLVECLKDLEVK